jgi:hypothetical protein
MEPRYDQLQLEELDFVPLEDELEDPAAEAAVELEQLIQRVHAARSCGA